MIKLTAAQQVELWIQAGARLGAASLVMGGPRFSAPNTQRQLIGKGLMQSAAIGQQYGISEAGRAWIAEQIEAAHVEALDENIERYPACQCDEDEWVRPWRMKARAGLYTWPKGMVALDERDAYEMDRRLDEADIIAARLGFDAHSEALIEYATHPTSDAGTAARMLARAGLMDYPDSLLCDDLADAVRVGR